MLHSNIDLIALNYNAKETAVGHMGIEITEVGENYLCGKMPVDNRTKQVFGLLHGGASVLFAETLGSYGSSFYLDLEKEYPVGLEINANHVKSASSGYVYGKATMVHCGKKTHIWDIRITNEDKQLVCISRFTVAVIEKK